MKEQVIRFRVSTEEKESIESEAKKLGISISTFIRLLLRQWSDGLRFEKEKNSADRDTGQSTNK